MIVCSGLQEKVWTRWPESLWARIQTHFVAPSSTSSIASTGFHSTSTNMWSYPQSYLCLHSFFYGAQKQYFSPHDMMATQLRCSRHSKRWCCWWRSWFWWPWWWSGRRSSTSCWRSTTCCRPLAGPNPGSIMRRRTAPPICSEQFNQLCRSYDLSSLIFSSNNMLADNNKCF